MLLESRIGSPLHFRYGTLNEPRYFDRTIALLRIGIARAQETRPPWAGAANGCHLGHSAQPTVRRR